MKAISIWQPHASLWLSGRKRYETRSWPLPRSLIGQRIAVHASKSMEDLRDFAEYLADLRDGGGDCDPLVRVYLDTLATLGFRTFGDLPRGALLGTLIVDAALPSASLEDPGPFGNFAPGRYAWPGRDATLFSRPVPYRGQQGFFDVPDELIARAAADSPNAGTATCVGVT